MSSAVCARRGAKVGLATWRPLRKGTLPVASAATSSRPSPISPTRRVGLDRHPDPWHRLAFSGSARYAVIRALDPRWCPLCPASAALVELLRVRACHARRPPNAAVPPSPTTPIGSTGQHAARRRVWAAANPGTTAYGNDRRAACGHTPVEHGDQVVDCRGIVNGPTWRFEPAAGTLRSKARAELLREPVRYSKLVRGRRERRGTGAPSPTTQPPSVPLSPPVNASRSPWRPKPTRRGLGAVGDGAVGHIGAVASGGGRSATCGPRPRLGLQRADLDSRRSRRITTWRSPNPIATAPDHTGRRSKPSRSGRSAGRRSLAPGQVLL
jgi:hypothetical protein